MNYHEQHFIVIKLLLFANVRLLWRGTNFTSRVREEFDWKQSKIRRCSEPLPFLANMIHHDTCFQQRLAGTSFMWKHCVVFPEQPWGLRLKKLIQLSLTLTDQRINSLVLLEVSPKSHWPTAKHYKVTRRLRLFCNMLLLLETELATEQIITEWISFLQTVQLVYYTCNTRFHLLNISTYCALKSGTTIFKPNL